MVRAGSWRNLDVAIKTIVVQSTSADAQIAGVASEAAIASNLVHKNVVATYSHDVCTIGDAAANELAVFKFYLIQVRRPWKWPHFLGVCPQNEQGVCCLSARIQLARAVVGTHKPDTRTVAPVMFDKPPLNSALRFDHVQLQK